MHTSSFFTSIYTYNNEHQTYTSSPELKHVMVSYLLFSKGLKFTDILTPKGFNPYMASKFNLNRKNYLCQRIGRVILQFCTCSDFSDQYVFNISK